MTKPTKLDIEILAKTIYGEARGEYHYTKGGLSSLIAVGNVVMNRVKEGGRYGNAILSVCLKPSQFSCWNPKDVNRPLLGDEMLESRRLYPICKTVAQHVAEGSWPDLTQGCNHYHASQCQPKWASPSTFRIQIGRHLFYKLE